MPVTELTPQNFEIVSGNDKRLNVTVLDEDNVPVDITGAVIVWAVSVSNLNKNRIFTYTSPTNITIILPQTGPDIGKFRIDVQDGDTEPLSPGKPKRDYYHEARMVSAAGQKSTVMIGTMTVLRNTIDLP